MAVKAVPGVPLSARELEVALLAANGLRNIDIAPLLYVSSRTVEAHMRHVYAKTETGNRVELVNWLLEQAPAPAGGACSEGGDHEEELNEDCEPPDYHCRKCGAYLRPA